MKGSAAATAKALPSKQTPSAAVRFCGTSARFLIEKNWAPISVLRVRPTLTR